MRVGRVDIKSEGQTVDIALAMCEIEISACAAEGKRALIVIHGYGSSGVGGAIKRALTRRLSIMKRNNKIVDYIPGEQWIYGNVKRSNAIKHCDELLDDREIGRGNAGVTIVLL